MENFNADKNRKINFSNGKRWFCIESVNGNLRIEYKLDEKVYIITRTDGLPFDGNSENVGALFFGNVKKPETLDEVVEYEVNSLAIMQVDPEVSMFNEFDWIFNDDRTKIIVIPCFLEEACNIVVSLPRYFDSVETSLGTSKRVRKSGMFLGLKYKRK